MKISFNLTPSDTIPLILPSFSSFRFFLTASPPFPSLRVGASHNPLLKKNPPMRSSNVNVTGQQELAAAPEFANVLGHKRGDRKYKYTYQRFLGRGGYGHAFLVERTDDGQRLVAKIIPIQGGANAVGSSQVKIEREIGALIQGSDHFGVTRLFDHHLIDGHAVLLMEYCDAGDLHRQITMNKNRGTLMEESVIRMVLAQLVFGLHHLHLKKLLHRDIKSSNVLLCSTGLIKLCDLGLAKIAENGGDNTATTFCGTPNYLAPEVWQRKKYGGKTDVYSLGVVLYHMMARKLPFASKSIETLRNEVISSTYERLTTMNLPYSPDLIRLSEEMMNVDPNMRPDTYQLLRNPIIAAIAHGLPETLDRSAQIPKTTAAEVLACLAADGVRYGDAVYAQQATLRDDPLCPPQQHHPELDERAPVAPEEDVAFAVNADQCADIDGNVNYPGGAAGGSAAQPASPDGPAREAVWTSVDAQVAAAVVAPSDAFFDSLVLKLSSKKILDAGTQTMVDSWALRRLVLNPNTLTLFQAQTTSSQNDAGGSEKSAALNVATICTVTPAVPLVVTPSAAPAAFNDLPHDQQQAAGGTPPHRIIFPFTIATNS